MKQPDNEHIESSLIGSLITMPEVLQEYTSKIEAGYFTGELHKAVFESIKEMHQNAKAVNLLTLVKELSVKNSPEYSRAAMVELSRWGAGVSIFEPIADYIDILKNDYITRSVSTIITEQTLLQTSETKGTELAHNIIKSLTDLVENNHVDEQLISPSELVQFERNLYYLQCEKAARGELIGIQTGLEQLNDFTGGWQSELIILAGRPSMGKTACALFHGLSTGTEGIYINCEMSKSQLAQRLILRESSGAIDSRRLKKRLLTEPERLEYEKAIGKVERTKFNTYYKPACGVNEAIRVIKKAHRKGQCNWAIIDYLQLLHLDGQKAQSREQEVSIIVKLLKRTQLELNIPIIVLAQISREVEKRPSKKPILSDLRESGEIEQTADSVIFIWRPAYYNLQDENGSEYTNEIFYLFEKHRQGAVGVVEFRHNDTMTDFSDYNSSIAPLIKVPALKPLKHFTDTENWDSEGFL
jgi:replicative DNA helicase